MSWLDLNLTVECPHCGNDLYASAEFNIEKMDRSGGTSGYYKDNCGACHKEFYFNARCKIECEVEDVKKKKPKERAEK